MRFWCLEEAARGEVRPGQMIDLTRAAHRHYHPDELSSPLIGFKQLQQRSYLWGLRMMVLDGWAFCEGVHGKKIELIYSNCWYLKTQTDHWRYGVLSRNEQNEIYSRHGEVESGKSFHQATSGLGRFKTPRRDAFCLMDGSGLTWLKTDKNNTCIQLVINLKISIPIKRSLWSLTETSLWFYTWQKPEKPVFGKKD